MTGRNKQVPPDLRSEDVRETFNSPGPFCMSYKIVRIESYVIGCYSYAKLRHGSNLEVGTSRLQYISASSKSLNQSMIR
jgi:hypothetical protein